MIHGKLPKGNQIWPRPRPRPNLNIFKKNTAMQCTLTSYLSVPSNCFVPDVHSPIVVHRH